MKMTQESNLQYTPLTDRAQKNVETMFPDEDFVEKQRAKFAHVKPRPFNNEGDVEILDGASFTHHFTKAPGDVEFVNWHYVEAGPKEGEVVLFLHGIPDAWYQWHHQMAALSSVYRCIAPDLKGYGQSGKEPGDYRHEGASEQLYSMLQQISVTRFNMVTHDRGTVQGDYIAANHPESVIRYGRGEQHLYNYNPVLSPQGDIFKDAPSTGVMDDPVKFVLWTNAAVAHKHIPDAELERTIQEYSYPGINKAVPRYFNSSTFRQEWLERRNRLMKAWKCPILVMQGYDSKTQPREFYEDIQEIREHIPNSSVVRLRFIEGGHFWPLESPSETTEAIKELLSM